MVQAEADKLGVAGHGREGDGLRGDRGYGIVSTPGIVIDGKVVHAGGLPKTEDLAKWLAT